MYESDDIVKHLFNNYGDGKVPWGLSLGILTALSCALALLPRYSSLCNVSTPAPESLLEQSAAVNFAHAAGTQNRESCSCLYIGMFRQFKTDQLNGHLHQA